MLRLLARHGDVVLAVGIVAAVGILVVPLPTSLVDVLLSFSIGGSVVLLLTATYVRHPVRFSALPAILLLATLFRLALNVSTTRLILSQADAGAVIDSFGSFVVGGNTVVGAVIFVILTVIQYVVIAKGAERVAEVGARFTLDALPGRQLAIDADLRSGAIDLEEAQRRRSALQRESKLYGALDGAMKFVKGDAIAGIIITGVNIAAGLAVGVLQQGLSLDEAARIYTLLTVGDGLVTQIPAILLATTAGVVVTQVAADDDTGNLARDIGAQIAAHPRALAITAGLLFVFALLPGLPTAPFALLAAFLGWVAWRLREAGDHGERPDGDTSRPRATPLRLHLSPTLYRELGGATTAAVAVGDDTDWLPKITEALGRDYGLALPTIELAGQPDPSLDGRALRLDLDDVPLVRRTVAEGRPLRREDLSRLLSEEISWHLADLVTIQGVSQRLERLAAEQPALVDAVIPKTLSLPQLTDLLRRLLSEGVSVRSLDQILEIVAREAGREPGLSDLVEQVRRGLGRQLTHAHADDAGTIRAWLVDEPIESMIRSALPGSPGGRGAVLEPELRDAIVEAMADVATPDSAERRPVLLTQADVRPHLRRLLAARFPHTAVLSFDEVRSAARVESIGHIRVA